MLVKIAVTTEKGATTAKIQRGIIDLFTFKGFIQDKDSFKFKAQDSFSN